MINICLNKFTVQNYEKDFKEDVTFAVYLSFNVTFFPSAWTAVRQHP
jgi:hypothetical protein